MYRGNCFWSIYCGNCFWTIDRGNWFQQCNLEIAFEQSIVEIALDNFSWKLILNNLLWKLLLNDLLRKLHTFITDRSLEQKMIKRCFSSSSQKKYGMQLVSNSNTYWSLFLSFSLVSMQCILKLSNWTTCQEWGWNIRRSEDRWRGKQYVERRRRWKWRRRRRKRRSDENQVSLSHMAKMEPVGEKIAVASYH